MSKQVITISATGAVSGLQRKAGEGINLQKLGHAETTRASEIVWDATAQRWAICIAEKPETEVVTSWMMSCLDPRHVIVRQHPAYVRSTHWRFAHMPGFPEGAEHSGYPGGIYYFREYEDAVRAEIAFLDALRLRGIF